MPNRLVKHATTALQWVALAAASWLLIEYLRFVGFRLPEPYALRWLETYLFRSSWQAFGGGSLYPTPNSEYIAPIYNPLYFLTSAFGFRLVGPGFGVLRFLSLGAFFFCLLATFRFHRIAGLGRILAFALATTLLFIPRALNQWMSTANLDAPMLALALWALVLLRSEQLSARRAVAIGTLLSLSFLVKQQAAMLGLAAVCYAFLSHGRASWRILAALGLVAGVSVLLLELRSGGVYSATTVGLPLRSASNPEFHLFAWCFGTLPIAFVAMLLGLSSVMAWGARRDRMFWGLVMLAVLGLSYLSGRKSGGTINNLLPYLVVCFWLFGEGVAAMLRRFPNTAWPKPLILTALLVFLAVEAREIHAQNADLARAHEAAPGPSAYRRNEDFEKLIQTVLSRYPDPVFVGGRFAQRAAAGRSIENFHQTALYEGTIRADSYELERILEAPLRERRYSAMLVWRRPEETQLRSLLEAHYVKRAELGRDPLIGLPVDLYEPIVGEH